MPKKEFLNSLNKLYENKIITEKYFDILLDFYKNYQTSTKDHLTQNDLDYLFNTLLKLLLKQAQAPYKFNFFHEKILKPFDYQNFGIDFLKPLVDIENSKIFGLENLKKIQNYIQKKENVVLLSNHQSEVDPILMFLLLGNISSIIYDIIFVAGERVITDPLAIPFSMGCNLLCIYSKRYIDIDIESKHKKQIHNKKTMSIMSELLSEGSKIIYVAPSGGRDRKDKNGKVKIAEFNPQSLEMLYLMCKKSKKPSHFFPFVLSTYDIFPPPEKIQIEMGEKRVTNRGTIFFSFLDEVDMQKFAQNDLDKDKQRENRANYIHNLVKQEYEKRM